MIHLDFETFNDTCNVVDVGAFHYATTAEIILAAWQYDDSRIVYNWVTGDPPPKSLIQRIETGELVCAYNVEFEYAILRYAKNSFTRKIKYKQLVDTAAMAAQCALPRKLLNVTEALGLPADLQKDKDGKRLIRKFCGLVKPTKKHPQPRWLPEDDPEDWEKFVEYNLQDVRAEHAVFKALPQLPPQELQLMQLTIKINERGIPIDINAVEVAQAFIGNYTRELISEFQDLSGGLNPTQVEKVTAKIGLPNLQEATIKKYLPRLQGFKKRMAEIRLLLSKASVKKFNRMLLMADEDNRIRGTLMYHGARNGRYTGKLVQPQSLKRGISDPEEINSIFDGLMLGILDLLYEDPIPRLAEVIRGFISAVSGKKLLIADYSAIEARILAWVTKQDDVLKLYKQGVDTYKEMASYMYSMPIEKVTTKQRKVGKDTVLGCGYQMGPGRFLAQAHDRGATDVTEEMAVHAVNSYRKRYNKVRNFWPKIEKAAKRAVATGRPIQCNCFTFDMDKGFLRMQLPSGRYLYFYKPRIVNDGWGERLEYAAEKNGKLYWKQIYGGLLTENGCSGIARDIMAQGMFNAEAAGFLLLFTVHDELIAEEDEGANTLQQFIKCITILPTWAKGIPLTAEGIESKRYRKA